MSYDIIFSASAKKQLHKLPPQTRQRIIGALERIRVRPFSFIRKLVNDPGYRLRVGSYRVILDVQQEKLLILVIKIGHRRNIYRI